MGSSFPLPISTSFPWTLRPTAGAPTAAKLGTLGRVWPPQLQVTMVALALAITLLGVTPSVASGPDTVWVSLPQANVLAAFPPGGVVERAYRIRHDVAFESPHAPYLSYAEGTILFDSLVVGGIAVLTPATIRRANIDYNEGSGDEFIQHTLPVYNELKSKFEAREGNDRFEFLSLHNRDYLITCGWHEPGGAIVLLAVTFIDDMMIQIGAAGQTLTCDDSQGTLLEVLERTLIHPVDMQP